MAGSRLAVRSALAGVLLALLAGCAGHGGPPRLDPAAARAFVEARTRGNPVRMQAVQSVVMSWRHRPFTALGWFRCDRERGTFALVGLSPSGATLFSVNEAGGEAAGSFAALPGGDPKAWTAAMAEDVRRIYFEGVPRPDDEVRPSTRGVVLRRRAGGETELRLRLETGPLRSRAEWYSNGRHVGTTVWEDYQTHGPLQVPMRIDHRNRVYGYRLVIRTKEIQLLAGVVPDGEAEEGSLP